MNSSLSLGVRGEHAPPTNLGISRISLGGCSGQVIRTLTDKFQKISISLEQGGCATQGNSYCCGAFVLNLIPLRLLWD